MQMYSSLTVSNPRFYANGRLACLIMACPQKTLQCMLGDLESRDTKSCARFRTTGRTNDLLRRGRPRVTTRGHGRYIMNTHLRNQFQTHTATAAITPRLHNDRIQELNNIPRQKSTL